MFTRRSCHHQEGFGAVVALLKLGTCSLCIVWVLMITQPYILALAVNAFDTSCWPV